MKSALSVSQPQLTYVVIKPKKIVSLNIARPPTCTAFLPVEHYYFFFLFAALEK